MNSSDPIAQLQRSVLVWRRITLIAVVIALAAAGGSWGSLSRSPPADMRVKSLEFLGENGDSFMLTVVNPKTESGFSTLVMRHSGDAEKGPRIEFALTQKSGFAHVTVKAGRSEDGQSFSQLVASPQVSLVEAQSQGTGAQLSAFSYEEGMGMAKLDLRNPPRWVKGQRQSPQGAHATISINGPKATFTSDYEGKKEMSVWAAAAP